MHKGNSRIFSKTEIILTLLCAFVALVSGVWGYYEQLQALGDPVRFASLFYGAVGLFVFEYQGDLGVTVPWSLELARWLAPLTLSFAAIKALLSLFREPYLMWRIQRMRGFSVVFGDSPNARLYIQNVKDTGRPLVVVIISEGATSVQRDGPHTFTLRTDRINAALLTLANVKSAKYLLLASENDKSNLELAMLAFRLKIDSKTSPKLQCATQISDADLANTLFGQSAFREDYDYFSARIINFNQVAARALLTMSAPHVLMPDFNRRHESLSILLVGDHSIVVDMVMRLAQTGILNLNIRLCGDASKALMCQLLNVQPAIRDMIAIDYIDVRPGQLHLFAADQIRAFNPDIIYLIPSSTEQHLTWLAALSEFIGSHRAVIVLFEDSQISQGLVEGFQGSDKTCLVRLYEYAFSLESIFNEPQDKLAIAIHTNYVKSEIEKGDCVENNHSLVPWHQLPESLKEANRGQADHLSLKSKLLTGSCNATPDEIKSALTEKTIEILAQFEHRRWVAEKIVSGWRYTSGNKNALLRQSPLLRPWHELSEEEKQKDRDAVLYTPALAMLAQKIDKQVNQ